MLIQRLTEVRSTAYRRGMCFRLPSLLVLAMAFTLSACGGESGELQILTLEPQVGATQGSQPVKIGGKGFRTDIGYTVFFGNKKAEKVTILNEETLAVITPPGDAGKVDITIRADNGDAFRIVEAWDYTEAGGNVMENVGEASKMSGKLAY